MAQPMQRAKVILALGCAQTLAWGSTYYLPAILAERIAADLGVSTGIVFGAFSAALIVSAVLAPLAGNRIDVRGGRDVLAVSSLVFALGLALLGAAQNVVVLFGAWLLLGVGMALGLYEAAFSTLAGIYGRNARGPITGITLIAGLASTICWPISAYLADAYGWRLACLFWAGANLMIGLPLNRFCLPLGTQPIIPSSGTQSPVDPTDGARRHAMVLLAFVFAATWFTSTAMAAHLPRLLQELGASAAAAIAAAALVGPAQVAARLLEFRVLQRFHPMLSARLAALTHPVGVFAALTIGAPAAVLFTLLHGAGNGILTIAKGTLPLALFGASGYGLRQGLLTVPARFGQAAAPLVFAVLIERYGVYALLLSAALGVASFVALAAINATQVQQTSGLSANE